MTPIEWFARNRVASNLLMWLMVLAGALSAPGIPQYVFPDNQASLITVQVVYRGASPDEMESSVCARIEEAVDGLAGLKDLDSTSREGQCSVLVNIADGHDINVALADVKRRVDALDTLPEEAERPVAAIGEVRREALQLMLYGQASERQLKDLGEELRDRIVRQRGIQDVVLGGTRPDEISIEVSEAALQRYALSFDEVAAAVRRASLELPGGSIRTDAGEIVLRTDGEARNGAEFAELVAISRPDGTRLRLQDIARVVDGFADTDQRASFNGQPGVNLRVYRSDGADVGDVSDRAHAVIAEFRGELPPGIGIDIWRDYSLDVNARTALMSRNGFAGLMLVVVMLALFLRPRVAAWVAAGMPISMLGAIALLPIFGMSIDMNTMLAFIVVIGILVDDAIVVGESIYSRQEAGSAPIDAAIMGARDVAVPVIFGVLTTASAFLPFLLVGGEFRDSARPMGMVVLFCLFFSLVESQLILPAHLAHGRARGERKEARTRFGAAWLRTQGRAAARLEWLADVPFRRALERAMRWRYVTLSIAVGVLAVAISLPMSQRLNSAVFPDLSSDAISAQITMPQGIPIEATTRAVERLVRSAEALSEDLGPGAVRHVVTATGEHPFGRSDPLTEVSGTRGSGSHLAEVMITLSPAAERTLSTLEIQTRWRTLTGQLPGVEMLKFSSALVTFGAAVDVELSHPEPAVLEAISGELAASLQGYPGVFDVRDTQRDGKEEIRLAITPSGQTLGLALEDLARQVRQAFYGEEVQRIQRGRDDVRVMVRYPEADRRSLHQLDDLRIRTSEGAAVPFATVAEIEYDRAPVEIRRAARRRVIHVLADIDRTQVNEGGVIADVRDRLMPDLVARYPGLEWGFAGTQEMGMQAFGSLLGWSMIALFVIYALLAIPLGSYLQPLLIMAVIPFGIAGALYGHYLMAFFREGFGLTMLSFLGIVALTGVVVNSSLVLVHNVNLRLLAGKPVEEAVVEATLARFRPIVLTSATTFAGLSPILLETSTQAQFILPIATSLAFGILFSTLVSLLLLPSLYVIARDLSRLRRARIAAPSEALPAAETRAPAQAGSVTR